MKPVLLNPGCAPFPPNPSARLGQGGSQAAAGSVLLAHLGAKPPPPPPQELQRAVPTLSPASLTRGPTEPSTRCPPLPGQSLPNGDESRPSWNPATLPPPPTSSSNSGSAAAGNAIPSGDDHLRRGEAGAGSRRRRGHLPACLRRHPRSYPLKGASTCASGGGGSGDGPQSSSPGRSSLFSSALCCCLPA